VYVDRPGILTRHIFLASTGDQIAMRDDTDVVANEIGVDLGAPDAFAVCLEQGVLDTNAEGLVHTGARLIGGTARAFAASRDWVKLTSSQDSALGSLTLADDARRRIVEDLSAGYVVVAPKAPVPLEAGDFVGWWRIDPATGHALGVASNGWGQDMAERGLLHSTAYKMAKQFAFDYLLCQSIPQVANQARPLVNRFFTPSWVKKTQADDAGALWQANHKMCLVSAIVGGAAFVTLPLLMLSLRLRYLAKVANALKRTNGARRRPVPRPAPPTPPPAKPSTDPALAKTDPSLPPTQRAPGGPGESPISPMAKSNPGGPRPSTEPLCPPPGEPSASPLARTGPVGSPSIPPSQSDLANAFQTVKQAHQEASNATGEWIRYWHMQSPGSHWRRLQPPGWTWDPNVAAALEAEMYRAQLRWNQMAVRYNELSQAFHAHLASGGGGSSSCGGVAPAAAHSVGDGISPMAKTGGGRGAGGGTPAADPLGKTQPDPFGKTQLGTDPLGKTLPDCPPNCLNGPIKKHPTLFTAKTQPDLSEAVAGPETLPEIGGPGRKTLVGIGGVMKTLGGGQ
jgi:hypothetical protein